MEIEGVSWDWAGGRAVGGLQGGGATHTPL